MASLSSQSSHEVLESLQKIYCPPLDEALFFAITSDYDLNQPESFVEAKTLLDSLKEGAVVEQELELLPETQTKTHVADTNIVIESTCNLLPNASWKSPLEARPKTSSQDADDNVTTGMSNRDFSEIGSDDYGHENAGYGDAGQAFDSLSDDKKIEWMHNMFPSVPVADVKEALARCAQDFERTADELLNISFLKETRDTDVAHSPPRPIAKGIDGFMIDDDSHTSRKSKGRNRRKKNRADHYDSGSPCMSDSALSSGAETPNSNPSNVWAGASKDIEFIASRTSMDRKTISSVYHTNGARLGSAIRALVAKQGEAYTMSPHSVDDLMKWQMAELKLDFERLSDSYIFGALTLADKVPYKAQELLEELIKIPEEHTTYGKVKGLASYVPVDLSEDEDTKPDKSARWSYTKPVGADLYTTSHVINSHGVAATQAFQQASAAYRRGKSDHLMGGAAAYYASIGHERSKAAKELRTGAANAYVARQSSATVLDLHGVNVSDAVRIARAATETWWEDLGDRKYVPVGGVGNGYRIVTGVGRHSADGIGRIGPAVSKMLVREGWKVQVNTGELIVLGRARKH